MGKGEIFMQTLHESSFPNLGIKFSICIRFWNDFLQVSLCCYDPCFPFIVEVLVLFSAHHILYAELKLIFMNFYF